MTKPYKRRSGVSRIHKKISFKRFEIEIRNIFGYYLEDICLRENIAPRTLIIRMKKVTGIDLNMDYLDYLRQSTFQTHLTINTLSNFSYAAGGSFEEFCRYYINYKKANREIDSLTA